jgi:RHS repeat-associated protein
MNTLEPYQQIYTYDTGNNLTNLSHQANSGNWQQTLTIHPNSNRGTENNNQNNFDANGNLLNLNNIGSLEWHYNNTLNKLTKANKPNTTQYYVYDYQGKRVRTVIESEHQTQSQRDYLPALDISINQAKQQSKTLHIGTHILSESSKDNTQTHYQLNSHLQSNTLELGGKAQTLSYEHYYPYGGTAIIAGKDKTQAQQKRYRYTGKERDDNSGLCYYGARYLAPWLARWINPDAAGSIDGLNLYVYVGNNPLEYIDPTGHVKETPEQETVEKGAVGEVNNVDTERPAPRKYRIDRDALSHNTSEEMAQVQQDIFQLNVFKKLGALESSSRNSNLEGYDQRTISMRIKQLRNSIDAHIANIKQTGVPPPNDSIQFFASKEYEDLVINTHKVANCSECALIMLNELRKNYPNMTAEYLITTKPDHAFNLINRDQRTPIFEPEKWNENALVVDAWAGSVYTKKEFSNVNKKLYYYGISNNITGVSQHIIKYVGSGTSYRTYEKNKMDSEESMF